MDYQDYSQELATISKEFKEYAFEYKKERAIYAEALNQLTTLIYKAGLCDDKSSFENKLPKLLSTPYINEARTLIKMFNDSRANYKGWEAVLESYKAQISAIQSVIKYNLQGELNTNIANKASIDSLMSF
jgi:hypothetical protein